jgi:type II secretion system protein N
MKYLRGFVALLWQYKWRGLLITVLSILFFVLRFPVDDLNDMITTKVAQATGNQVYVQFDKMALGFLPLSLELEGFSVEAPGLSPLTIKRLEVVPSLTSLLLQKPAGRLQAEGLFRGVIKAELSAGKKLEGGIQTFDIAIEGEGLQLNDLRQYFQSPVAVRGKANLNIKGYIDPTWQAQPDLSLELAATGLELQSSSVNTLMGPLNLPDLKMSGLNAKSRLSAGNLLIEDVTIGKENQDELAGKVSGQMGLELKGRGPQVFPLMGSYSYKVNLGVQKTLEDRAKTFLLLIEAHRTPEALGGRYRFNVLGDMRTGAFNFTALQ